jgi:hypothetical protein
VKGSGKCRQEMRREQTWLPARSMLATLLLPPPSYPQEPWLAKMSCVRSVNSQPPPLPVSVLAVSQHCADGETVDCCFSLMSLVPLPQAVKRGCQETDQTDTWSHNTNGVRPTKPCQNATFRSLIGSPHKTRYFLPIRNRTLVTATTNHHHPQSKISSTQSAHKGFMGGSQGVCPGVLRTVPALRARRGTGPSRRGNQCSPVEPTACQPSVPVTVQDSPGQRRKDERGLSWALYHTCLA